METFFIIGVLVLGFAVLGFLLRRQSKASSEDQSLVLLQNQIAEITRSLDLRLGEIGKSNASQYGEAMKLTRDVTEKLAKLEETNRQVVSFTDQIKNLERVLTNSKNRGGLGEAGLELILSNILPPGTYQNQYAFANGDKVDAVIFVKDQLLPVDAKFSLDNYRRIIDEIDPQRKEALERDFRNDLKKRIDETAKYIRPDENTLDFAFMFIPAEGIYYDLLVNEVGAVKVNTRSLIEYAFNERKVVIVSPTTFAAYLQTVLQGLRALQIEESAKEIRKRVEELGRHLSSYESFMKKLGTHLGTTVNSYNTAYRELGKLDKDVLKISGKSPEIEPLAIARPTVDVEELV